MESGRRDPWLLLAAVSAVLPAPGCASCSDTTLHGVEDGSSDGRPETGGPDTLPDTLIDPVEEIPCDVALELPDPVDGYDPDIPPPPYVPQCGNGVLDPGEECDDRNRLDGDGCDWLCRLGDGDDPREPDPSSPPYRADGDPVAVVDEILESRDIGRIPLVWTGSQYATAYYVRPEGAYAIRFIRFTSLGSLIDAGWAFFLPEPTDPELGEQNAGLDLVWTGDRYALFFADVERGLMLLFLDANGKPLGSPVLVEPDHVARAPSASLTSDGFVLAWLTIEWPPPGSWGGCGDFWGGPPRSTRVRLVAADGSTAGLPGPVLVDEDPSLGPDIAAGESGYGIVSGDFLSDPDVACAFRFIGASADLSSLTYSGYLGDGVGGEVVLHDDRFITAWMHEDELEEAVETCVARFTPGGDLERPPACEFASSTAGSALPINARLDAGRDGLGIIYSLIPEDGGLFHLYYLATDSLGTAVADEDLVTSGLEPFTALYAIRWADDVYGVMFETYGHIQFQRYSPEW